MKSHAATIAGVCAAAALLSSAPPGRADEAALLDKIKQLETRVADLEGKSTQTVTQASIPSETLEFLGQTKITGYVSASYLYNFATGAKGGTSPLIPGRGFDVNNNSFTINKLKIALEKPVDYSATNWAVGYRADLIVGQDAPLTHSAGLFGGPGSGTSIDLEQAFIDFNLPIGNGLKVFAGKMVSPMGVEVIEEVNNPVWSVGNQFLYLENFTETGVQLAYKWNDQWDSELYIVNGWDQVTDGNTMKSFFGRVGFAPDTNTSIAVVGYGGPEPQTIFVGGVPTTLANNANWREGIDIVASRKFGDKLTLFVQGDYGHEENAPLADGSGNIRKNAEWFGIGSWLTYDVCAKLTAAMRVDYMKDGSGVRTPSTGGLPITGPAMFTVAPKELTSLTFSLNYKPIANLQIRPEIRWDHSSAATAFAGQNDQFTAGVGVAYLY